MINVAQWESFIAKTTMEITDQEFPVLAGLCGFDAQIAALQRRLVGTFAGDMTDTEIALTLGLKRRKKDAPFDGPDETRFGETRRRSINVNLSRVTLCATSSQNSVNALGREFVMVTGRHNPRASKVQLALINHVFQCPYGHIRYPNHTVRYSRKHLRRIYKRFISSSRLHPVVRFLDLVSRCRDWKELETRVVIDAFSASFLVD